MRVERGDPPDLDFEALAEALRAEGFKVELADREEATHRVLREDVGGVWQVVQLVLDHIEKDAEDVIVGVLAAWAWTKISKDDDPDPGAGDAPPQANLWLPDGSVHEIPLDIPDEDDAAH